MKRFFLALAILVNFNTARANDEIRIDTFTSSIVTLSEEGLADFSSCALQVCQLANSPSGTGKCDVLDTIGVILVDLTDSARDAVLHLNCVEAVEQDGVVHANPRSGRSN